MSVFVYVGDAKEFAKQKQNQGSYKAQYRSNLTQFVTFFENVNLRREHLECLRQTPFYHMVLPFARHMITHDSVKGSQIGTLEFMLTFNKKTRQFEIGGKSLTVTPADCECIFGMQSGAQIMHFTKGRKPLEGFANRHFAGDEKVKMWRIKQQLIRTLAHNNEEATSDVVRLIVLHLMANLFFVSSGEFASWWLFRYCESIEDMATYNWGQAITEFLLNSAQISNAEKVQGCTTLLLYWICERTTILSAVEPEAFPRFRKWWPSELGTLLNAKAIKDIQPEEVNDQPLVFNERELRIFAGEEQMPEEAEPLEEAEPASDDNNPIGDDDSPIDDVPIGDNPIGDDDSPDDNVPIGTWMSRIGNLKKEVNEIQEELANVQAREVGYKQENLDLKSRLSESEATIKRMESEIAKGEDLQTDNTLLKNANQVLQDEKNALEAQIKILREEASLRSIEDKSDYPTFDLLTPTQPSKSQIEDLQSEIAELKSLNESLHQRLASRPSPPRPDSAPADTVQGHLSETDPTAKNTQTTQYQAQDLEIIDYRTEIELLKTAHLKEMKKKDMEISELEANLAALTKALDAATDNQKEPIEVEGEELPVVNIGKRTRSQKPEVTPESIKKVRRDLGYQNFDAYKDMSPGDQYKVDSLSIKLLSGE